MSTKIKIEWDDELKKELAPLYVRYDRQTKAQPAHVELEQDGTLTADWSGEIGGTPMDVYHRRRLWWDVDPHLTGQAVADLLAEIAPLAQRVLDGWTEDWDGNNNVGTLTEDAQQASDEIERLCIETATSDERVSVYQAREWISDYDWPSYHWTGSATWQSVASEIEEEARGEGVLIDDDTAEALKTLAMQRLEDGKPLPLAVLRLIAAEEFDGDITADTTDEEIDEYNAEWIDSARNLRDGLRKAKKAD